MMQLASSRDTLGVGLTGVGFDPTQRTLFTWLGVVPYLTEQPVFSTLGFIASCREVLTSCSTMAIPRLWAPTKTNTPPLARPLPRASPPRESLSGAILRRTCSAPSGRPSLFA